MSSPTATTLLPAGADAPVEDRDKHIQRGGAFRYAASDARCAFRNWGELITRESYIGFRVARTWQPSNLSQRSKRLN